ncbi:protein BTG2 [Hydra vulgaris]|uniref:Protein BTG1 n=1 Tax=Hydra vulgaris TaxID=6087 RepID=T2ME71_HYDVU|nr:protein BTG2 [Hydra vulgaris]
MLKEVKSAVQFLTKILSWNHRVPNTKLETFSNSLEKLLQTKYERHWHPEKPFQGSAFRCIRINAKFIDPSIIKAADMSGLTQTDLEKMLPKEFTIWIDPHDVSYRIGEDGSICDIPLHDTSLITPNTESSFSFANQHCHSEVPRSNIIESTSVSTFAPC